MTNYDYVVLFKNDDGEWEKTIIVGKEALDKFLAENQEAGAFVKRFLDSARVDNVFFDSYLEAEVSAQKTGGQVHPAPPPKNFSSNSPDIESYYQDP